MECDIGGVGRGPHYPCHFLACEYQIQQCEIAEIAHRYDEHVLVAGRRVARFGRQHLQRQYMNLNCVLEACFGWGTR